MLALGCFEGGIDDMSRAKVLLCVGKVEFLILVRHDDRVELHLYDLIAE